MAALLLSDTQIGIVASVSLFSQALGALLGGVLSDKLGRKLTTVLFDLISWTVPCLLWAFSQNFWWFVVAAGLNGLLQITNISWNCLLVEDAEGGALVRVFSLIHLAGQMSVVFAPFAALLVDGLTIVPAMRILYLFSFFSMTAKFVVLYRFCDETKTGRVRKRETAGMSIFAILFGYGKIFTRVFSSSSMVLALVISACFTMIGIAGNFFGLYVTNELSLPEGYLAYFPILRAVVITFFLFVVQPRVSRLGFRRPMLAGVLCYVAGHAALIFVNKESFAASLATALAFVFLEACAFSLVMPRKDAIVALFVQPGERARIVSVMMFVTLAISIPFGYLVGWLSDMDRRLPFLLNLVIFAVSFVIIAASGRLQGEHAQGEHV